MCLHSQEFKVDWWKILWSSAKGSRSIWQNLTTRFSKNSKWLFEPVAVGSCLLHADQHKEALPNSNDRHSRPLVGAQKIFFGRYGQLFQNSRSASFLNMQGSSHIWEASIGKTVQANWVPKLPQRVRYQRSGTALLGESAHFHGNPLQLSRQSHTYNIRAQLRGRSKWVNYRICEKSRVFG